MKKDKNFKPTPFNGRKHESSMNSSNSQRNNDISSPRSPALEMSRPTSEAEEFDLETEEEEENLSSSIMSANTSKDVSAE